MAIAAAPASWTRLRELGRVRARSSQPFRILTVTGILTAFTIAADDGRRVLRLPHQAAAGVVLGNLRHRASHVDIDDVGAHAFDDPRGLRHLLGIATKDLNRDRPLLLRVLRVLERAIDAANEPLDCTPSRSRQARSPLTLDEPAKCRVGHARHRRDDKGRRQ